METRIKERVFFIDILRFVALIMMAIIHTSNILDAFGVFIGDSSLLMKNASIIYLVSPTIFMFAMGASINLASKNDGNSFIKRGIRIVVISLLINFIRGAMLSAFYAYISDDFGFADAISETINWTVGNDILMFAGLYFIIFGFINKFKDNRNLILAIVAVVFYVISLFIPTGIQIDNVYLDSFLGNFILVGESYFPILTWFIIPTIAYFFFKKFLSADNKDEFMLRSGFVSLIIFVSVLLVMILTNKYESRYLLWGEDIFYFDLPTLVLTLSLNYVYLALIYYLAKYVKQSSILKKIIIFESSNLTNIYLAHWISAIMLGIILCISGIEIASSLTVIIYGVFVAIVSSLIVLLISKTLNNKYKVLGR